MIRAAKSLELLFRLLFPRPRATWRRKLFNDGSESSICTKELAPIKGSPMMKRITKNLMKPREFVGCCREVSAWWLVDGKELDLELEP